ncbi:hypothetical protein NE237_015480 [Protea cynaroides]|uniref:Uncharacterized protein n=1 Tax=Protea cynaroides TaxID=273540 RepID=A0A9Q0KE53_9MAGN|nr:hypothetical protein NE237_015480 [Protea cynaroides]
MEIRDTSRRRRLGSERKWLDIFFLPIRLILELLKISLEIVVDVGDFRLQWLGVVITGVILETRPQVINGESLGAIYRDKVGDDSYQDKVGDDSSTTHVDKEVV